MVKPLVDPITSIGTDSLLIFTYPVGHFSLKLHMKNITWLEISASALKHNIKTLRQLIGPNVLLAPCIKANAYGHGLIGVAKILEQTNTNWLSIDSLEEANRLRQAKIKLPLLIMGYIPPENLANIIKLRARIFISNLNTAKKLNFLAQKHQTRIPIHIKVDTGMSRQGILASEFLQFFDQISQLKNLKIEGIATHFISSDEPQNIKLYNSQIKIFKHLQQKLANRGEHLIFHAANSGGVILHPESHFDLVRPGISTYGLYPSLATKKYLLKNKLYLMPVLTWQTKIALIKTVPKNSCVSYSCAYKTNKKTQLTILPVGYYDGIDRRLSNNGFVLIKNKPAPILGRVCMNITVVNTSHIPGVQAGDTATLLGNHPQISADFIAKKLNTINYEVITRLRETLPRIVK